VKKFALGMLAAVAMTGSAVAADMAPRYTKAPPPAPIVVYNWTGCYIGGNIGGGWAKQDQFRIDQFGIGPAPANYGGETGSAFIGGGQVGCDYQFAGNWVVGIQVQGDWGSIKGSHALPAFPTFTMFDKTDFIGTVTGRIGYLFAPQLLGYVKGGGAWTRSSDFLQLPGGGLSEASGNWNASGWTVGGGLEWMFAPGWSVFGEYNYMDFGTRTVNFIAAPGLVPTGEHVSIKQTASTALVGVNYKFNWGGPVVAKY
jgi:outer membrane immunogenic protein